ncbi:MAG: 4Fe-4S dicluster domain-containing protein [Deltaproteobacteria bacterium]|nr:4Fe-4S dicluster domain-containing protein [Deltaproteobacteria bacterium]
MAKQTVLKVSGGRTEETIKGFLKSLLEKGVVEAILIPKRLPSGDGFAQTLIHDPEKMDGACILSLTMPVQSAKVASNLSIKNLNKKVAAVLKACEIRAIVELAKFLQVKLENLIVVGVDCPGTFEVTDYAKMVQEGKESGKLEAEMLKEMEKRGPMAPQGYAFRPACQMCEYPVPKADIHIKLFGYKTEEEVGLEIGDKLEKELEEKGLLSASGNEPSSRKEVVDRVVAEKVKKRDAAFQEFSGGVKDLQSFLDRFSTCIRCHNCMVACPICYCKECVFRTAIFEHEGDQFLRWADRKGGIRMPTDTLIFHLIRMTHMVTSCIGCGLCDSACPSRLPVATLFRSVGDKIQKMFNYVPGRDVNEVPPVATFKEDELKIESGAI